MRKYIYLSSFVIVTLSLLAMGGSYRPNPYGAAIGNASGYKYMSAATSEGLGFFVNGSTPTTASNSAMYVTSTGYVGIGTATPVVKMQIKNNGNGIQGNLVVSNTQSAAADLGAAVLLQGQSDTTMAQISAAWTGAAITDSYLAFNTRKSGVNTEQMRISNTGYVGINTTSPETRFHIGAADLGNGAAGPAITVGRNTNATNPGAGHLVLYDKGGTAYYLWVDDSGVLRIHTAAPTTANDAAGTVVGDQTGS